MRTLFQDLRYGARMLLKSPGFTAAAVLTLALGVGANTAIFSVVNAVMLRPLPFRESDRLALLWSTNSRDGNLRQPHSFPDFNDIRQQSGSFSEIAAASPLWLFVLSGGAEPEQIQGQYVSANLFPMLGAAPQQGRVFLPEEDQPNGAPAVIISESLWRRYFGGDPAIVGKTLGLNGSQFNIVGVMPAGFQFLEQVELWVPAVRNTLVNSGRSVRLLSVVGRLKPDVTIDRAGAEAATIARRLEQQYPDTNSGVGARVVPLYQQVTGTVRPALLLLSGAVGALLLIACVNVANLLLARSASRRKELAIRAALGAGRARLIRQLLTESVTLSLAGGVAGLLVAIWGVDLLLALSPAQIPRYNKIGVDLTVLLFTLAVALGAGLLFGLAPALQTAKINLIESLKDGARGTGFGHRRISNLLAVTQIAMTLVLLIGAGLLVRSFIRLLDVNPGFVTENVLTAQVMLPAAKYAQPQQRAEFYRQLETRLKAAPEIASVGAVTRLPLGALSNVTSFAQIEGQPGQPGRWPEIDFRRASDDYFRAMGIPLRTGRFVTEQDVTSGARLIVINEAMARRFWPNEDPIGKRLRTGVNPEQGNWQTIVGVVGNVRHMGLDIEPRPEIYLHTLTNPLFAPVVVLRAKSDPQSLVVPLRNVTRSIDSDVAIANINTMEKLVAASVAQRRFSMLLLVIFAAIALALSAVGVYGVINYSVAQRTNEIGVRMALGAGSRDVIGMVLKEGMLLALIGAGIGAVSAFALTRVMTGMLSSLLFSVRATDPVTFAGVAVLLGAVSLIACYIPARRAAKVDPMVALRTE
ncbi:MAG: ABC transporter permease [Blastocatellia bacterium]